MRKHDLQNFDIVETKLGNLFMVCADNGVIFGEDGWMGFDNYDDSLVFLGCDEDCDIAKVRRPNRKSHYWPYGQTDAPIIWEREKKPELSHEEEVILRALNKPDWWIAKDWCGLYLYEDKPVFESGWGGGGRTRDMTLYDHLFDLVERNKDCYQVKDLLGDGGDT